MKSIFEQVQELNDAADLVIKKQISKWTAAFEKQGVPKQEASKLARELHELIKKELVGEEDKIWKEK